MISTCRCYDSKRRRYAPFLFLLPVVVCSVLVALTLTHHPSAPIHRHYNTRCLLLDNLDVVLLLPLLHLLLLLVILLDEISEHFLQALAVGLQGWDDIGDSALDQDAINETEALAIGWEWLESLQDEPNGGVSRCLWERSAVSVCAMPLRHQFMQNHR